MTGQELAALAYRSVDASGPTDFARKIGLVGAHVDKRVKRWLEGTNEPDFDGTIRMLAAAGLLREGAEAEPGSTDDRLRELAAAVGAMVRTNAELHARVADVETELRAQAAKPQPGPAGKRRSAGGSG